MTVNFVDGYQPSVERLEIHQLQRIKHAVREVRCVVLDSFELLVSGFVSVSEFLRHNSCFQC